MHARAPYCPDLELHILTSYKLQVSLQRLLSPGGGFKCDLNNIQSGRMSESLVPSWCRAAWTAFQESCLFKPINQLLLRRHLLGLVASGALQANHNGHGSHMHIIAHGA